MGCLIPILAIFMPRVTMVVIFFFTNWFQAAFQTILWPLLGFILMPYTTLAWMAAMLFNNHILSGPWILVVVIAAVIDLGGQGHSARWCRRSA